MMGRTTRLRSTEEGTITFLRCLHFADEQQLLLSDYTDPAGRFCGGGVMVWDCFSLTFSELSILQQTASLSIMFGGSPHSPAEHSGL